MIHSSLPAMADRPDNKLNDDEREKNADDELHV